MHMRTHLHNPILLACAYANMYMCVFRCSHRIQNSTLYVNEYTYAYTVLLMRICKYTHIHVCQYVYITVFCKCVSLYIYIYIYIYIHSSALYMLTHV